MTNARVQRGRAGSAPAKAGAGLAAVVLLCLASAEAGQPQGPSALEQGRTLVARNCGQCHAVGRADASPHASAPALRDLSRRYPVDNLGEGLAEGLLTGHPDMPEFRFSPAEVEAILIYLESIQARQLGRAPTGTN